MNNTNSGSVYLNLTTGSNNTLTMNYYWKIENYTIHSSKNWLILDTSTNDFSIAHLISNFRIYVGLGIFGLTDFGVGIIVFLIIVTLTGTMKIKYGITDETVLIGIIFSLVALFDISFGLVPNPINAVSNFPTIFMSFVFVGFLLKEVYQ
jgi:hypothetical protein